MATVTENTRLTHPDHFQDTRKISLSFAKNNDGSTYEAGDVLMIQPENDRDHLVLPFIELIGLKPTSLLQISVNQEQLGQVSATSLIPFPQDRPISAFELFSFWLNLSEPPSR